MTTFRIDIAGEYGDNDGSIHLMDGEAELVMWDSAEWIEDPSLVFVIANAIRKGFEEGPDAVRSKAVPGSAITQDPDDECYDTNGVPLPYGRCDTCGSPCDESGCTTDRAHVIAMSG